MQWETGKTLKTKNRFLCPDAGHEQQWLINSIDGRSAATYNPLQQKHLSTVD
jgi:hypothetical protein